ncbi:hypothetical protein POTOM_005737 [Populus tomentosa]|uniref:Uncharacterized protein n=1 Tax=Populus tomentosa TaxID=118781 RepID=A0A8X8AHN4_POPTO|nr:hypothetical protein POTOM_005737 [Populus tomentosa]
MGTLRTEPTTTLHVVAMPYPGRGHVNPMMNLCELMSSRKPDILFTFVVTEEWYDLIHSDAKKPANIHFATIPNCIPSEVGRAKDFLGFLAAVATKMEAPFEQLLDRLELPVNVIIADTYLDWVVHVGNRRNIPVASLWTMSAYVFSLSRHVELLEQNGHFPVELSAKMSLLSVKSFDTLPAEPSSNMIAPSFQRGEERVDYIPGIPPTRLVDFPNIFHGNGRQILPRTREAVSLVSKAQYLLFTSFYDLEAQVISALKPKFPFPVYPIGPSIPYFKIKDHSSVIGSNNHNVPGYIEWLNSQPEGSVLYVSMGSFLSVSSSQLDEIVAGVHNSGVRFLWVSRGETTPFKDGGGDMGLVVPCPRSGFYEAVMKKMEGPLEQLPDQIDLLVTAIIADAELPWAITIANKRNIPVATPCTVSATVFSMLQQFARIKNLPTPAKLLGRFLSISSKQMDEIAAGLRNSGV